MNNTLGKQKKEVAPYFKWIMLFLVIMNMILIGGFSLTSFSVLAPEFIIPDLNWTKMDYALVWGASAMGIMLSAFLGGILFDKIKHRYLMSISVILAGISVFLRAHLTGVTSFYAIFLIIGFAQGLYNPGNIKIITSWFPRKQLGLANGLLIAGSPIGMFSGFNLAVPIMNAVGGWRNMYFILGILIGSLSLLWLFVAKDKTNQESELSKTLGADTTELSVWHNMKILFKTKQVWLICLSDFFFMGMILIYLGFSPTVFKSWPGVTTSQAGFLSSMANLGSLIGYFTLPRLSDKFARRKPFVIVSSALTAIFWLSGVLSGNYNFAVAMLLLGGFCNGFAVTLPRVLLQEHHEIAGQRSGTALGMLFTAQRIAGVLFPIIYTNFVSGGLTPSVGLGIILSGGFVSAVLMSFADETGEYKKKLKENKAL